MLASLWVIVSMAWPSHAAQAQTASLQEVEVRSSADDEPPVFPASSSKTSISGQILSDSNLQTLSDASIRLPGFYGFGSTPRLTGFTIRGLGNNQFNDGLDSSVGLYVDGVYLARQSYGAFGLFDIEDITVLRGPQGAAYGLGSTAGEVHLRTRAPSHTAETEISLGAGNYGYQQAKGSITGSLVPGELAGRLSVYSQQRDGLLFNRFNGEHFNNQDRLGVRGQLLWTPRDDLVVRVTGEYGLVDQRCCSIGLLAPVSPSIQASDEYMGYNRPGTNPYDRVVDNNVEPQNKLTREAASVVVEWGPVGRHRFVSITGVNQIAYDPAINDDGTSMRLLVGSNTSRSQQVTQELRWHSRFKRLDTTLGLFYMRQNLSGEELGILGDEIALWALGGVLRQAVPTLNRDNSGFLINTVLPPQALNGLRLSTPYSQVSDTFSTFASADLHTGPNTTVTTGIRYTGSRRDGRVSRSRSGGNLDSSPLALTNSLALLSGVLGPQAASITYDSFIDSLVGESFDRQDSRKDSGVSGQLVLQHKLSKTLSGYASLSRGYKSGGLNLAGLSDQVRAQFDPEIATGIELGLRKLPRPNALGASLALYDTRVKNFQALTYAPSDGLVSSPRQNNVLNIPAVRLQGVELDLTYPINRTLLADFGLAYNRAISTSFSNAPNEDTNRNDKNLSGKQLYNAPRWSGFAALEKRFPMPGSLEAYVGVEHAFRTETFGAVDQSRNSFIDAYQLTNLRLGLRNTRLGWNVQGWVKNLFDEDYLAAVAPLYSLGEYGGFAGDPLTYGVSLDVVLGR